MNRDLMERFEEAGTTVRGVLAELVPPEEVEPLVQETRAEFQALAGEIPYADRQDHAMFPSSFSVFVYLAIAQAVRPRDFDTHTVGRAFLTAPQLDIMPSEKGMATMGADSAASMTDAADNEFAFELVAGDEASDFGMNVHSCAVCHAFAKHGAMDLVPYMCAMDDVASEIGDLGLRRTGTIALGATHCDFRYERGREPLRLADQYPERIRTAKPS